MEIYISRGGERVGPYSPAEINRQLAAGTLTPIDEAWSEGSPGWKPLAAFPGIIMPGAASSTPLPVSTATVAHHPVIEYGGFWLRCLGFFIDAGLVAIPAAIVLVLLGPAPDDMTSGHPIAAAVIVALVWLGYFAGFWLSRFQATPGQKLCGLEVVDAITWERVSVSRALLRALALLLAIATVIGCLMVGFTDRKRGLHDLIASTVVLRRT